MQIVNWTDHQLAKKIRKFNLNYELKADGSSYYYSDNYKMEIIVVFNNSENKRTIIYSLK